MLTSQQRSHQRLETLNIRLQAQCCSRNLRLVRRPMSQYDLLKECGSATKMAGARTKRGMAL